MIEYKSIRLIKTLVLIAIVFSFLAVIAGSPYTISIVPVNMGENFSIGGKSVKVINAQELATWIIDKKNDFALYDIRPDSDYKDYHIPHSLNSTNKNIDKLSYDNASVSVIYDQGSRYVIEKIKLLVKDAEDVYLLKDGMKGWRNEVLFPDLRNTKLSKDETDKIYKISSFFGGKPVTNKERKRKKYSREGC